MNTVADAGRGLWPDWPPNSPAIRQSIASVIDSGQWGQYQGEVAERLRRQIAKRHTNRTSSPPSSQRSGVPTATDPSQVSGVQVSGKNDAEEPDIHVRLTCSGTMAIELALRAAGIGQSGRPSGVVLAAYDYPGNFRTIELLGGRPILIDVQPENPTVVAEQFIQVHSDLPATQVGAVIVSHLHGYAADVVAIQTVCQRYGWVCIEDACQAPAGRAADNRILGTMGDFSTISFGGSKPITAGNGGALLTHSDRLAARVDAIVERPGDVVPLSPLQCAALLPQWDSLDVDHRRRDEVARQLHELPWESIGCQCLRPYEPGGLLSLYKFPILAASFEHRAECLARWTALGLPIGEGFRSLHRTSKRRADRIGDLGQSAKLGERLMVLDHRALLADDAVNRIASIIFHGTETSEQ